MSLSKRDIEHIGLVMDKKLQERLQPLQEMVQADHQTLRGAKDEKGGGLIGDHLRLKKRVAYLMWIAALCLGGLGVAAAVLKPIIESALAGLTLPTLIRIFVYSQFN